MGLGRKWYPGDGMFAQGDYDTIFDIDVGGGQYLKLPFNSGDNALVAAEKFVIRESLPKEYIQQISQFVNKNSQQLPQQQIPQQSQTKPQVRHVVCKWLPLKEYIIQETANLDGINKKIQELNSGSNTLDNLELTFLNKIVEILKDKSKLHAQPFTSNHMNLVKKLLQWPNNTIFPVFDLLRIFILFDQSQLLFKGIDEGLSVFARLVEALGGPQNAQVTSLKALANCFRQNSQRRAIVTHVNQVLPKVLPLVHSQVKTIQVQAVTVLVNYAVVEIDFANASAIMRTLVPVQHEDADCQFKALLAMGTLLCHHAALKSQVGTVKLLGDAKVQEVWSELQSLL